MTLQKYFSTAVMTSLTKTFECVALKKYVHFKICIINENNLAFNFIIVIFQKY